jgi:hypothetical protein
MEWLRTGTEELTLSVWKRLGTYHLAVHESRHVKQLCPEQGIVRTCLTALAQVTCNLSWCLGSKPAPVYKLPDWWLDWSWWNTLWQKPTRRQQTLQIPYINMLANPFHTLSPKKDKPTWYTYIVCQINTNHAKLHQAEKPTYPKAANDWMNNWHK